MMTTTFYYHCPKQSRHKFLPSLRFHIPLRDLYDDEGKTMNQNYTNCLPILLLISDYPFHSLHCKLQGQDRMSCPRYSHRSSLSFLPPFQEWFIPQSSRWIEIKTDLCKNCLIPRESTSSWHPAWLLLKLRVILGIIVTVCSFFLIHLIWMMVQPFFIGLTIAQTIRRRGSWCWWSDGGEPLLQFSWPVHSSMAMFKNEFTLALPKIKHISTNLASDLQTPGAWPSTTTAKARKATKKRALTM